VGALTEVPDPDRAIVLEMEEHLEAIRRASGGDRRRELEALFLLALEREALAAVGYGGEGIHERIDRLDTDAETRAVVAHALRWASRDEGTHAVLARGLLARTGRLSVAIRVLAAKLGGLVAGWAAAVVQHTSWRKAPLSQLAARAVVLLGRLGGKVPETAAAALAPQSFSSFCRFQVGAEKTAVISWQYIAELLAREPAEGELARVAARIAADERKHEQVLGVLVAAFDDEDRLREGHDRARLVAALEEIDPAFVRALERERQNPLGRGGVVVVREDPRAAAGDAEAVRALLRAALAAVPLPELRGKRVAIKTTFMMAYDRRDPSPHVDLALADELALALRDRGARDVAYLETPNHYDESFSHRGVGEVARYIGFASESYRVVDADADQVEHAFRRGIGQDSVCRAWKEADVRVVLGKMRSHPSMLAHLTVSTLESLGRRIDELLFHDRQADLASGSMMLLDAFPPDIALLDATHHVPDGLTGILGDPTPSHPGRIYAARDALALDLVAARHMGIERLPRDSALSLAIDWFDDPRPRALVDGPDTRIADFKSPHRNDLTVLLSTLAYPVYLLGGDRGSLWVPVMDRDAFPFARRQTPSERCLRPLLRALFGFGRAPVHRSRSGGKDPA
jgi:uncharacterized protein (DUF362 family)